MMMRMMVQQQQQSSSSVGAAIVMNDIKVAGSAKEEDSHLYNREEEETPHHILHACWETRIGKKRERGRWEKRNKMPKTGIRNNREMRKRYGYFDAGKIAYICIGNDWCNTVCPIFCMQTCVQLDLRKIVFYQLKRYKSFKNLQNMEIKFMIKSF